MAGLRILSKYQQIHRDEMLKVLPGEVVEEINSITPLDRRLFTVFRRMELVAKLRDRYQLSYPAIGLLLLRDHSSIINLYRKAKKLNNE